MNYPINVTSIGTKIISWCPDGDFKIEKKIVDSYRPYFFIYSDDNGNHLGIDGRKLNRLSFNSLKEMYLSIQEMRGNVDIYESDIPFCTKFLIDTYKNVEDKTLYKVRTFFDDIETETEDEYGIRKFPNVYNPTNRIISISFYDNKTNNTYTFVLAPDSDKDKYREMIDKEMGEESRTVIIFSSEEELLESYVDTYSKSGVQIEIGWNNIKFDLPYKIGRIKKLLGDSYVNKLSPVNKISETNEGLFVDGITHLDYMTLYKLFAQSQSESYGLDFILNKELGEGKIQHGGDLDLLWKRDFAKFVLYNRRDVGGLKELDDKLKYIDLARELTSMANVRLRDVYMTSRIIDGFILTRMKRKGLMI